VAAAALGAAAYDLATEPPLAPTPPRATPTLREQTLFCPPAPAGGEAQARLALATGASAEAPVRVEPPGQVLRLGRRRLGVVTPGVQASSLTAFDSTLAVHGLVSLDAPVEGAMATACSDVASERWYFAAGSSAIGFDDRLWIFNPFLDEAVVRIIFYTPHGPKAKAGLADLAVPAGRAIEVAVNDYVLRQPLLATEIQAKRGRVVAWRQELRENPVEGASLSLGAPAPAASWFLPDGVVGRAYATQVAILNPSAQEAIVTVAFASPERVIQPPELVETSLPPGTARAFALRSLLPVPRKPISLGTVVRSVNGVEVVVERVVRYATEDEEGIAAEVGVSASARRWELGPAARRPERDAVAVLNAGRRDARVTAVLLQRADEPIAPRALRGVVVPAGLAVRLPVARWTQGEPMAVLVSSDEPVVVERSAYSRAGADPAAARGLPLPAGSP
jgi:hypothetical protein